MISTCIQCSPASITNIFHYTSNSFPYINLALDDSEAEIAMLMRNSTDISAKSLHNMIVNKVIETVVMATVPF